VGVDVEDADVVDTNVEVGLPLDVLLWVILAVWKKVSLWVSLKVLEYVWVKACVEVPLGVLLKI